jgi:hypothetical protein
MSHVYFLFLYSSNKNITLMMLMTVITKTITTIISCTECHGRVVNTPASYSGGTGFISQPRYQLS